MNRPIFFKFIILEIITILLVTLIFIFISNHLLAGRIAGTIFLGLGIYITLHARKISQFWRFPTFILACIHLVISLTMIITRTIYSSTEFKNVIIAGIPGPLFHKLSSIVYIGLIIASSFDWIRAKKSSGQI